jgi:hypothetical protein
VEAVLRRSMRSSAEEEVGVEEVGVRTVVMPLSLTT